MEIAVVLVVAAVLVGAVCVVGEQLQAARRPRTTAPSAPSNSDHPVVPAIGFLMVATVLAGVVWLVLSGIRWLWERPLF